MTGAPPVNKWLVTVSLAFGSLMATIDASIVNVALPVIRGELGATIQEVTWISTAYMIAMVLVMPLTGFLGARFGQKRVYVASLVLFVVGSVLCGMARSLEALMAFRILQGLGGGALQPTQQAILRQTFPASEQGMAMAIFSMVIMIGPAIGPVIGGWVTDNYSWPWIFYINLPIGLLGIVMTTRYVHESEDVLAANRARAAAQRGQFDWQGLVLMAIGVGALQFFFEEGPMEDWFDSTVISGALFIAVVALAFFVVRELTTPAPVVNLRLFRDPTFAAGSALGGLMYAMLMGSMFLLPVFMQEMLHFPATLSGVALLPRTVAMMIVSPIIGRIYNRVPPAAVVGLGAVIFIYGSWSLGDITSDTSAVDLIAPLAITGVAIACLFIPLTTAALTFIPRHQLADAAGLNSFVRQISGSIGLTIFATLFTRYGAEAGAALGWGITDLRPEVAATVGGMQHQLAAAGVAPDMAQALAVRALEGRAAIQGMVIGFDRTFLLQAIAFVGVLPFLYFLRVGPRRSAAAHVDLTIE